MSLLGKLYVDPLLTDFAVGFEPQGFIAGQLLPVVEVPRQSFVYAIFDQADMFRAPQSTHRAPGTEASRFRWRVGSDTGYCFPYAAKTQITMEEIAGADPVFRTRLELQRTRGALIELAKDEEQRLAGMMFSPANVGSSTAVASGWLATSGSNPVGDINTAIDNVQNATGYRPNTMVIGIEAWRALRRHPDVINKAKNPNIPAGGNYPATEEIARLFEMDTVLVGGAYRNAAQEGQSPVFKPYWGPHVGIFYIERDMPSTDVPTFGAKFRWVADGLPNRQVEKLPYDAKIKAQEIEAGYFQGEKVVSKPLGFLVNSVL